MRRFPFSEPRRLAFVIYIILYNNCIVQSEIVKSRVFFRNFGERDIKDSVKLIINFRNTAKCNIKFIDKAARKRYNNIMDQCGLCSRAAGQN